MQSHFLKDPLPSNEENHDYHKDMRNCNKGKKSIVHLYKSEFLMNPNACFKLIRNWKTTKLYLNYKRKAKEISTTSEHFFGREGGGHFERI